MVSKEFNKQEKPAKKIKKRTLLSKERTLLAEIRTSSIFIGITFLIYFKIRDPFYKKILLIILTLIAMINTFLVFYFYNEQKKSNRGNQCFCNFICFIWIIVININFNISYLFNITFN